MLTLMWLGIATAAMHAGAEAAPPAGGKAPAWPDIGVDGHTADSALEHILDRTIVVINGTSAKLYFDIRMPNESEWVQYPATPGQPDGIYCPTCDEDAVFRFFMATKKGPIKRELKANYRYMIIVGDAGNWDLLQGPALH